MRSVVPRGARRRALLVVALVVATALPAPAQRVPEYTGQTAVVVPEATSDGTWDGTWYHRSVDARIALWFRTRRKKTEMKLRYESGVAPVGFETDWKGLAEYYAFEKPATFRAAVTRSAADRLEGTWSWDSQFRDSGRRETGSFTLFRALDGRALAFQFKDYELLVTRDGTTVRTDTPPLWMFQKGSKRLVLWDELPF